MQSSRDGDSQVGKEKEEPSKSKEKDDAKEEKEEKTTQRITRCLRSHTAQMQQQQKKDHHSDKDKQGNSDSQPQVNELSGVKGQKSGTTASTGLTGTPATTSASVEESDEFSIHPRKRKLRPKPDQAQTSTEVISSHPIVLEKPPNPYKTYLSIRKQVRKKVEDRRKNNAVVHPKAPQGFKDYLMMSCSYVLQGNSASTLSVPMLSPPNSVTGPMRELFLDQEQARYKLRLQHLIEKEKLMLSIEQEMLREHARAARAQNNQSIPLSVCTILRDEEIYNLIEAEQVEEREKNVRSRYNGRQFISWIQDVGDKYDKIKELLLLRHHHEAESLFAVQKMDWEWKMKEVSDLTNVPVIDDLHVPMVQVNDDFDLLPS